MLHTPIVLLCLLAGPPQPGVPSRLRILAESKVAQARAEAAKWLEKVGPPGEGLADESDPLIAGLLRAVEDDKDKDVRESALGALLHTARATPRVMRALGKALCGPEERVRSEARRRLGGRGAVLLPALRFALGSKAPSHEAVEVAGSLGKAARPLVPALEKLLRHESLPLRYYAALALLDIDPDHSASKADDALASALAASFAGKEKGTLTYPERMPAPVPRTARLLGEQLKRDLEADSSAIHYLENFGRSAEPAAEGLEVALEKGAIITRLKAAIVLVRCGRTGKAGPWLVKVLQNHAGTGSPLPSGAYYGLSFAGPAARGAVPLLMRHLRDVKGADRAWAAWCLYQLNLEIKGEKKVLRTREVALDALIRLMKDEDRRTSGVATMRLCLVAGPNTARAVPALIERMAASPDHREYILNALGRIGPAAAKAAPAIRKLLRAESAWVREEAALALARVKPDDPETMKALLGVEDRLRPWVAVAALGGLGPRAKAAVPVIVRRLRGHARFEAADALWKIGPATARKLGAW